ncbi:NAD(P)/FAD-dependent oxidoreductase [Massilia sp. HP4]|uniref:NAD(P)/FAD-dependent oxidoreductase n=1 Tax=Massilia sp. HP4 TaxID=2562316 RepID=UPI0035A5C919
MDMHKEGLPYTMLAHHNDFTFVYGSFAGLDAAKREITVAAVQADSGDVIVPQRRLGYAKLCIAVGSTSHYFNTPGVQENTISLNAPGDAERFRQEMLMLMTWAESRADEGEQTGVDVIIIGGGATGVELAAELREASNKYIDYGFRRLDATRDIRITLLEGSPRILPPLPERVAATATALLEERDVRVIIGCRVAEVGPGEVVDAAGRRYPFQVCAWAAGIKAPAFLATLGLPTNAAGQLEVSSTLNVIGSADIYALGDCAACTLEDGRRVPPRAQAAHQQADYLYRAFLRQPRTGQQTSAPYVYRDYGSLVSLGSQTSVGTLMGSRQASAHGSCAEAWRTSCTSACTCSTTAPCWAGCVPAGWQWPGR